MIKNLFFALLYLLAGTAFFGFFLVTGVLITFFWDLKYFTRPNAQVALRDLREWPGEIWEILKYGEWPIL